jgi:hypothetical protein
VCRRAAERMLVVLYIGSGYDDLKSQANFGGFTDQGICAKQEELGWFSIDRQHIESAPLRIAKRPVTGIFSISPAKIVESNTESNTASRHPA